MEDNLLSLEWQNLDLKVKSSLSNISIYDNDTNLNIYQLDTETFIIQEYPKKWCYFKGSYEEAIYSAQQIINQRNEEERKRILRLYAGFGL